MHEAPRAPHFVIAHSHGGNVALYALRDEGLKDRTTGVACLATPFIHVGERDLGKEGPHAVVVALVLFVLFFFVFATGDYEGLAFALSFLGSMILFGGLMVLLIRWTQISARVRDALSLPDMPKEKLLILRMAGDEAAAGLGFAGLLSDVVGRLVRAVNVAAQSVKASMDRIGAQRTTRVVNSLTSVLLLVALAGLALEKLDLLAGDWLTYPTLAIGFLQLFRLSYFARQALFLLLTSLLGAMTLPIAVLVSLLLVFFGWQLALGNILLDVTAESTPPGGPFDLIQLAPRPSHPDGDSELIASLRHSVYEDDRALDHLCAWLQRKVAEHSPAVRGS